MDGLLILDLNGSLILHSNFHPRSFLLHQFIHSISTNPFKLNHKVPPLIYFNPIHQPRHSKTSSSSSSSSTSSSTTSTTDEEEEGTQFSSLACNLIYHQLWFAVIASTDFEPTIGFEYLEKFKNLLFNTYLQSHINNSKIDPGPSLIQAHFDLVLQLVHLTAPNTLQSPFGKNWSQVPLLLQFIPNKLDRSIVDFLADSAQYTFKNEKHRYNKPSIFTSPIPWRPIGLEYPKEEICLDLVESISVILDQFGEILKFEMVGFIDFQSKLNGLPDISIKFNDPSKIKSAGFHNCVRQGVWKSGGNVTFIPPDGTFRLMSYERNMKEPMSVGNNRYTESHHSSTNDNSSFSVPIRVEPKVTVGKRGGSFTFKIKSSHKVSLNKLIIRWKMGRFAIGIVPDSLVCLTPDGRQLSLLSSDWNQDLNQISWSFNTNTDLPINCCLSGLWSHKSPENQPDHAISVEFESTVEAPNISFIGLKIENILVKKNLDHHHSTNIGGGIGGSGGRTVHKGVKMKFNSGVYQVRWE